MIPKNPYAEATENPDIPKPITIDNARNVIQLIWLLILLFKKVSAAIGAPAAKNKKIITVDTKSIWNILFELY